MVPRDHPRSRGVYRRSPYQCPATRGSSPLARGLLMGYPNLSPGTRIIPARAGFTAPHRPAAPPRPDHPRSRGVYVVEEVAGVFLGGSSPLARGLPELLPGCARVPGIIRLFVFEGVVGGACRLV